MIKIAMWGTMLLVIAGMASAWIEEDKLRHGTIPAQTIYIQKTWAEQCGLGTCYYAATESRSMRLQSAVWFDDTTDRDLFIRAVEGYNCAVITHNMIRQIEPGHCPP
jgi:hypothetical protein